MKHNEMTLEMDLHLGQYTKSDTKPLEFSSN
jgi:hypothetical protein